MTREYVKKEYVSPFAEVEWFDIVCVISTSGGQGRFDEEEEDETGGTDAIDSVVVDNATGEVKAFLDEDANEISQDDLDSIY